MLTTMSSAFWSTDLDYQLRQRDITHVALAGLTANTCLEATGRHAVEWYVVHCCLGQI